MAPIQYSENPKLRTAQKVVFWAVIGLAGVTAFGLLFGLVVQFLWNATLVPLFEVSAISFWQAVGVFILAKIVFGFGGTSSSATKSKKEEKREQENEEVSEGAEDLVEESLDLAEIGGNETFRTYWEEEGREAYEAFQLRKGDAE